MSSLFDKSNGPLPYFSITGNVNVTAPTFVYGSSQVSPGAELMSSSGATMSGVLTLSAVTVYPESGDQWTLPMEGNIFDIQPFADTGAVTCTTSYTSVTRINNAYADRFVKGSIITMMFPECGNCVPCLAISNSAYISLLGGNNFAPVPSSINSSLVLMSNGYGTWREVSRNGVE